MLYQNYFYIPLMENVPSWEDKLISNDILIISDFENTIATIHATVYVRNKKTHKILHKLSLLEFNNYILDSNEYFTFEEFNDINILLKKAPLISTTANIINAKIKKGCHITIIINYSSIEIINAIKKYIIHYFPHAIIYNKNTTSSNTLTQIFDKLVLQNETLKYKGVEYISNDTIMINTFNKWAETIEIKFPEFKYYGNTISELTSDNITFTQQDSINTTTQSSSKNIILPTNTQKTVPKYQISTWEIIRKIQDTHPTFRFINYDLNSKTISFEDNTNQIINIKL